MEKFTQRQVWKVLRGLVSDNNAEIKRIFSASISATYKTLSRQANIDDTTPQFIKFKSSTIGNGVKEVYKQIANRFFEKDLTAKQEFFRLNSEGANWQDYLSARDLFYLYSFQNRVLSSFQKVENLTTYSAVQAISTTNFGKYFSGSIEFTGKPQKTPQDKSGFDAGAQPNIEGVLLQVCLSEHQRYCKARGLDPEATEQQMIEKIRFDKYTGGVASRYFKQRALESGEFEEDYFDEETTEQPVTHPDFGRHVGFTEQGSPLYENEKGNFTSSTGESYSGHIFGFKNDSLAIIGSTQETEDVNPTE